MPAGPSPDNLEPDPELFWQAMYSRDRRFDGRFFVGTITTGIYCRSTCPISWGHPTHIKWFPSAAAAEAAGFRPCLRCRPDASPGSPAWLGTWAVVSHALKLIFQGALDEGGVEQLAERVGIGSRHLRRLFEQHLGASPLKIARSHRAHVARNLITQTRVPITEIAFGTGFRSIRQFNHTVRTTFGLSPRGLRRLRGTSETSVTESGIVVQLPYCPPIDWTCLIRFLRSRATPGVEIIEGTSYRRTIEVEGTEGAIEVWNEAESAHLLMRVILPEYERLMQVVQRVRRMFDLGTDALRIGENLAQDPRLSTMVRERPGLRVPAAWDGFEIAVRAVLGQQLMSVDPPTLVGRLVQTLGKPVQISVRGLSHLFPRAQVLAEANLPELGVPRAQAKTIRALAYALSVGAFAFDSCKNLEDTLSRLRAIPGLDEGAACYIAMRSFGEADALPYTDRGLRCALATRKSPVAPAEVLRVFELFKPWRAYAAMHFWAAMQQTAEPCRSPLPRRHQGARHTPGLRDSKPSVFGSLPGRVCPTALSLE
jgi:AraC family transcriptional regulator, regulatory protein of adaptative response / DNA-3-methyladenine glycosylase II